MPLNICSQTTYINLLNLQYIYIFTYMCRFSIWRQLSALTLAPPRVLQFGEVRLATAIESSVQWCGWRLRFDVESKLSSVTKTFVVKDSEFRDCGTVGLRGGVRSTVLVAVFIRMRNWCRTAQGYACTCALPGRCGQTVRF
jgi:hypothetical protein